MGIRDLLRQARDESGLVDRELAPRIIQRSGAPLDVGNLSKLASGVQKGTDLWNIDAWMAACGKRLVAVRADAPAAPEDVQALPAALRDTLFAVARAVGNAASREGLARPDMKGLEQREVEFVADVILAALRRAETEAQGSQTASATAHESRAKVS